MTAKKICTLLNRIPTEYWEMEMVFSDECGREIDIEFDKIITNEHGSIRLYFVNKQNESAVISNILKPLSDGIGRQMEDIEKEKVIHLVYSKKKVDEIRKCKTV